MKYSFITSLGKQYLIAVVEQFFGRFKHNWLFIVAQPTREYMQQDVAAYIKIWSGCIRRTAINHPLSMKNPLEKMTDWSWPEQN